MANRNHWAKLISLAVIFSYPAVSGAARNGIHMWRDSKGVLNISNVNYSPNRITQPRDAKLQERVPKPKNIVIPTTSVKDIIPPAPERDIAIPMPSKSVLYSNIYTYTDNAGVRHFTNIPVAGQRYESVLQNNFIRPAELRPRLTSAMINQILATRKSNYDNIVSEAAQTYQVDQALVNAVIHAESAFNPLAVSPKGAAGLMQLMPGTAQRYGVMNSFNPTENVYGGVRYLRDLLAMFNNDLSLAIAAYNAGENAVTRYGGIPPYAETTGYVQRVLDLHSRYRNQIYP